MARVITFSTRFQKKHPRAGQPTFFVEKIVSGEKKHTIRKGNRFKKGMLFSARIWTGKSYCSPQKTITDMPFCVEEAYDFEVRRGLPYLNGNVLSVYQTNIICENDGLEWDDFVQWILNQDGFQGQIICWHKMEYDRWFK